MNNKITLPPISDILVSKEPHSFGCVAPHHHLPVHPSNGFPVPYYSYNYMNTAAAPKSSFPSLYSGAGSPSYMYGSNYSGYSGPAPTGNTFPAALHMHNATPGVNSGTLLVASETRRSSLQTPGSVQTQSPEMSPASPGAGRSDLLQTRSRTRNNLPKETTYILLKWLNDHLNHPYPNSFEKTQLMMTTGLNQQQLSNWFINARRRKIKALRQRQKLASN